MHTQPGEGAGLLADVGEKVRRLRQAAEMTQTELAARSQVSRRTIINLEAGEANISLSGLDRLASALGTTFVSLVADPAKPASAIDRIMWRGREPSSVAVLLASAPATSETQLWTWSLAAGERYDAEPDPEGWTEMILVTEGTLEIALETRVVRLEPGEHTAYASSQQYSYVNAGDGPCAFARLVIS